METRRGHNLEKHRRQNQRVIRHIAIQGQRQNSTAVKVILCCVFVLIILLALFISINESVLKLSFLPTWDDLYRVFGYRNEAVTEADVSVHFIDVGQGDSELIICGGKTVLIDCGEKDYAATVSDYLLSYDIKRLDYIIASHPHSDHIGGMAQILAGFEVGKLIMPEVPDELVPTTACFVNMLKTASSKGVAVEYAQVGSRIQLSEEGYIDIFAPVGNYEELNDYSVVAKFVHKENSFLFVGDIESTAESDIIESGAELSADVLKVAHHGSSSSSKTKFLKAVNPEYAVIEVGTPNSYNHPNQKVLERLEERGCLILRTDSNGNIVFESDGYALNIITKKGNVNAYSGQIRE